MEQAPNKSPSTGDGFVLLGDVIQRRAPDSSPPSSETALEFEEISEPEIEVPAHLLQLDRLFTELEPIDHEQVVLTLAGSAASRLAGRAAFLGLISSEVAAELGLERDWQALLEAGLGAEQLALLVRAEPWLPPVHHGVSFCRWLVSQAVLSEEQLADLGERSLELGWPIFQVALEQELLDEERYVDQLSRFSGLERAEAPKGVSRDLLVSFPVGWVEHFDLVPLERGDEGLVIALARPLPTTLLEQLVADAGSPVVCRLACPADVAAWRRRWLRRWWRVHHPGKSGMADN